MNENIKKINNDPRSVIEYIIKGKQIETRNCIKTDEAKLIAFIIKYNIKFKIIL